MMVFRGFREEKSSFVYCETIKLQGIGVIFIITFN